MNSAKMIVQHPQFMKNYAKVGGKKGRPAYRTPSSFRYRQVLKGLARGTKQRLKI